MRLTLASLQTEMRQSFTAMSKRVDNLDINVNERIDRILLRLDGHIKDTDARFRAVDERFDAIDRRFDVIDQRFEVIDRRFEVIDRRFDDIDRRFDDVARCFDLVGKEFIRLKENIVKEIIDGMFPYMQNVERMLNNHEHRITTIETRLH